MWNFEYAACILAALGSEAVWCGLSPSRYGGTRRPAEVVVVVALEFEIVFEQTGGSHLQ